MEKHWHIYFERAGGFTGIPVKVEVDSNDLPVRERDDLHRMIIESTFFELEPPNEKANTVPDGFRYTLIIEGNDRKHKMYLGEQEIPDQLRGLLRYLTTKARKI